MTVFKHVMSGPGAAGDVWTTGIHTIGTNTVAAAEVAWNTLVASFGTVAGVPALWPTQVEIRETATYALDPTTGKATSLARGNVTVNGTSAGEAAPPRDCVVVGLRTAKPGPGGRGRMYLPLFARSSLTPTGLITDVAQTALAAFMANALNDLDTAGQSPVVWRKGSLIGDNITSVTVSAVPGNQRRRSNKIPASYKVAVLA